MAVVAADFTIAGGGRLNPAWFAGQNLNTLLATWITRAGTGSDAVITARVYQTAFTFLSDQFMSDPAMQRDRDKTDQYSGDQLAYWQAQAAKYAAELEALTGVGGPVITPWEGEDRDQGRFR